MPTRLRICGTCLRICRGVLCSTSMANATFSNTVFFGSRRKSWNTVPTLRRNCGISLFDSSVTVKSPTWIVPSSASISFRINLINVDLPAPLGPTRNTKSPLWICTLTSSKPMLVRYFFVTCSNVIMSSPLICDICAVIIPLVRSLSGSVVAFRLASRLRSDICLASALRSLSLRNRSAKNIIRQVHSQLAVKRHALKRCVSGMRPASLLPSPCGSSLKVPRAKALHFLA